MGFTTPEEFASAKHDYIIIGGGAAGLLLAARLSEDPDIQVGVLEAGGDQSKNPLVTVPGLAMQTPENPDLDWAFTTVPQKHTHDRVHGWPRGKCLGGSSAINTMMFSHPSKRDLDSWKLLGNEGWDYDSMRPYFCKYEHYHPPSADLGRAMHSDYIDPKLRGSSGTLQVSFCESSSGWIEETWIETAKNAHYPAPKDPRGGVALGAFNQLMAIDPTTKTRSYSHSAFLEPNLGNPHLRVLTNAKASRLVFAGEKQADGAVATGVQYSVAGQEYTASAAKEIIVSAGSIQSPQILELSGIGDPGILEKYDIPVVVDNTYVGTNLQDHPLSGVVYEAEDGVGTAEAIYRDPELAKQLMDVYTQQKAGPLTGGLTGTGFSSLRMVCPELSDAEVDQLVDQANAFQSTATRKQLEIQEAQLRDPNEAVIQWIPAATGADIGASPHVFKMYNHSLTDKNWVTMAPVTTHMFSRGTIHIQSADPAAHPAIDPNYLSHPLDVEIFARALMHARQLCRTEPWASKLKTGPDGDKIPMPCFAGPIKDPKTLEEAKDFVRWNCVTCYHPIGTCSMLPRDEGGVVDSKLKVYGTKNVRVVDASIFPLHVQGNIMSVVYATAEKAAEIIKAAAT